MNILISMAKKEAFLETNVNILIEMHSNDNFDKMIGLNKQNICKSQIGRD